MPDLVSGTNKSYLSVFHFDLDITVNSLLQLTLWTFHSYYIIVANGYSHTIRNSDRFSTYTRHTILDFMN